MKYNKSIIAESFPDDGKNYVKNKKILKFFFFSIFAIH